MSGLQDTKKGGDDLPFVWGKKTHRLDNWHTPPDTLQEVFNEGTAMSLAKTTAYDLKGHSTLHVLHKTKGLVPL